MRKPHEEWIYFAEQDLAFAKAGQRDGFFAHVCFLCQQAVEKAMKGYLVYTQQEYPKTHSLRDLHRLMKADWLNDYQEAIQLLSLFYAPVRYPDAIPGSLPDRLPREKDASEALEWAEEILEKIKKKIRR